MEIKRIDFLILFISQSISVFFGVSIGARTINDSALWSDLTEKSSQVTWHSVDDSIVQGSESLIQAVEDENAA